jgi:integrase
MSVTSVNERLFTFRGAFFENGYQMATKTAYQADTTGSSPAQGTAIKAVLVFFDNPGRLSGTQSIRANRAHNMIRDAELRALSREDRARPRRDLADCRGGLSATVHPTGTIVFWHRYQVKGTRERRIVGRYPDVSLAGARLAVQREKQMIRQGVNPAALEREAAERRRAELTLAEYADQVYLPLHVQKMLRTDATYRNLIRDVIPAVGHRKLSEVQRSDIIEVLDRIVERGAPTTANRTLSAANKLFSYAVGRGDLASNPLAGINRSLAGGPEKPRETTLSLAEIRIVWRTMDKTANVDSAILSALKVSLLTGCRIGEITGAHTSEFDLSGRWWTIPGARTKNQRPHKVWLSDLTLGLVDDLMATGTGAYLFSSPKDPTRPINPQSPRNAIVRADFFGIKKLWYPHDLRRSCATGCAELGVEPYIVEKLLNHQLPGLQRVYNRAEYWDRRREALELWSAKVAQTITDVQPISLTEYARQKTS